MFLPPMTFRESMMKSFNKKFNDIMPGYGNNYQFCEWTVVSNHPEELECTGDCKGCGCSTNFDVGISAVDHGEGLRFNVVGTLDDMTLDELKIVYDKIGRFIPTDPGDGPV